MGLDLPGSLPSCHVYISWYIVCFFMANKNCCCCCCYFDSVL